VNRRIAALLAPASLLWMAGVIAPLLWLLRLSLYQSPAEGEHKFDVLFYYPGSWTLENYRHVLTDPFYVRTLLFTVVLGLTVTGITVFTGYVLGYAIYRAGRREKIALLVLIAIPKFTSLILFIYGLKMMLGSNGFWPVVAGETLMLLPYAALTIAATLEAVPYSLVEAARGLGASPSAAFRAVTLPLSLPGTLAATLLVLLWSLGAFLSPYLLGEPSQYTAAVQVERLTYHDLNWPESAALNAVLMAAVAALGYGIGKLRARL